MVLAWLAAALVAALSAPLNAPKGALETAPQSAPRGSSGCVGIPRNLADRGVADAIAAVPSLSALAGGIRSAGLVAELNRRPQVTLFAPTNEALAKLSGPLSDPLSNPLSDTQGGPLSRTPADPLSDPLGGTLSGTPADPLSGTPAGPVTLDQTTLRYHVVPERLTPERLIGTHRTLHGALLSVVRAAAHVQVNAAAGVICTRVQAANGNVYLIDAVLTPR